MPYQVIAPRTVTSVPQDIRNSLFKKVDWLFRYPASKELPEGWVTWQSHPIDPEYGALLHYDATRMTLVNGKVYWYTEEERRMIETGKRVQELREELERRENEQLNDTQTWLNSSDGVEEKLHKDPIRTTRRSRPYDPEDFKIPVGPKVQEAIDSAVEELVTELKKELVNERIQRHWLRKSVYRRYQIGDSEVLEITEIYLCGIRYMYRSERRKKGLQDAFQALH